MSHFNDKAATWDSDEKIAMMKSLAAKTLKALKLTSPVNILDFGCGTGLFGLELADYARTLLGVDTSEGMLAIFDKKTIDAPHITSKLVNLETDSLNQKFDLIVSSMAFHHLAEPGKMVRKFKNLLNPHGSIAIVDLEIEDGTFHPDNKGMGVKHFGFSSDTIKEWAQGAGLSCDLSTINAIDKNGKSYGQFLAIMK